MDLNRDWQGENSAKGKECIEDFPVNQYTGLRLILQGIIKSY